MGNNSAKSIPRRVLRVLLKTIIVLAALLSLVLLLLTIVRSVFTPYVLQSDSMAPTITEKSFSYVSNFHYTFFNVKRGDIILFRSPGGVSDKANWVQRIVALPGDRVEVKDGFVSVNDELTEFSDTKSSDRKLIVPEGQVFVKGDSPNGVSLLIPQDLIIGKFVYIREGIPFNN